MGLESASKTSDDGVILHVVSFDLARGAERHARALVDVLNRGGARHQILTLFASEPAVLDADVSLEVPMGFLRRAGLDPRVLTRLRREVRRRRPAALVAHGGEPAKYAALAIPRNLPWVYLRIGTTHPRLKNPLRRVLHDLYTKRATMVVAVSTEVADELHEVYGMARARIVVIHNGRDPDVFRPSATDHSGRPPRLVFVGHLDQGKRPEWFIETVRTVRARGVDLEAIIVGDGPLQQTLTSGAESAGVSMLGARDDVAELLAESDVLVLTSRPPEGMPGVLIEAGMAGLPVVSTRVPGSTDVIDNGVTGFIVDVDDQPSLVDAVFLLATDERLRSSMGRAARNRCVEKFSLESSAALWRELLENL